MVIQVVGFLCYSAVHRSSGLILNEPREAILSSILRISLVIALIYLVVHATTLASSWPCPGYRFG